VIFKKGMLNTLGNAIQRVAVLLIYVIAGKGMDAGSFGVASSLIVLATTIGSLASLSLGHTANRTLSRVRLSRLRSKLAILIMQVSLLSSLVAVGAFVIFSESIVSLFSDEPIASADVVTIAIAVFSVSFGSSLKGHLWADMRYGVLLASSVVSAAVLFSAYGLFIVLDWPFPLLQAYAAMVVSELFILGLKVIIPLGTDSTLLSVPNWRCLRPVLRFSSIATLNGLSFTPVNLLLISMITAHLGSEVVGRFNILVQVRNAIVFLPNGFASVILSIMSSQRRATGLWRNSAILGVLAGLVALPVVILAYFGRPAGTGSEYMTLLVITALTGIIIALNTNIGQVFLALGKLWTGVMANSIWSIMTLGFVALVLFWGFGGLESVLLAIMLAYGFHTIVQLWLIRMVAGKEI